MWEQKRVSWIQVIFKWLLLACVSLRDGSSLAILILKNYYEDRRGMCQQNESEKCENIAQVISNSVSIL